MRLGEKSGQSQAEAGSFALVCQLVGDLSELPEGDL